ncbi:MAG: metallophosphoesterase family protein [Planctomycetota bacterium]
MQVWIWHLCILILFSSGATGYAERGAAERGASDDEFSAPLRFVVLAHLQPMLDHAADRAALVASINRCAPSFVCVLGDSDLSNEAVVGWLRSALNAEVCFLPGNHDIERFGWIHRYVDVVGRLEQVIVTNAANLVFVNSLGTGAEFRTTLERSLADLDRDRPTVLFCHHPIWDDSRKSDAPMAAFPSYAFAEVRDVLRSRVDVIFAGNYLRAVGDAAPGVSLATEVDGMLCYTAGMHPARISYLLCEVERGEVQVAPQIVRPYRANELPATRPTALSPAPLGLWRTAKYTLRFKQFWFGVGLGACGAALAIGCVCLARHRRRAANLR